MREEGLSEAQFLPMILDPPVRGKADTPAEMPAPSFPPTYQAQMPLQQLIIFSLDMGKGV